MGAFNDFAFKHEAFSSHYNFGLWSASYSFDYESGATVYVTPNLTMVKPEGTDIKLYCSEDGLTWTEMVIGAENFVLYTSNVSGSTTIYVKIELFAGQAGVTPVASNLSLLIHQETSLYTIARQVMSSGLSSVSADWFIDEELQKYPIQYAWLGAMSHRKALAKIAQAAGGVVYQDRRGTVRIEAGNYIQRKTFGLPTDTINSDRIINMESPVSEVANKIQITTLPYEKLSERVVWELSGDNAISAGLNKTFTVNYSGFDAVVEASAVLTSIPSGATILSESYFFGGAEITVHASADQVITLTINGKPLQVTGSRVIIETDGDSIRRYGVKSLVINDNNLIQTTEIAELIAESIVAITASASRDIDLDWRGDPTDELGDVVSVNGTHGVIVAQELNFNGALKASMQIRRVE